MICPTCGTSIPDGSLRCPACHASVGVTVTMPPLQGRWCPSCGAGASWEDEVCPRCGMPLERTWGAPGVPEVAGRRDGETPVSEAAVEAAETQAIPRIESAIPAEDDPTSKVATLEEIPRANRFLLAAVASIVFVCGLALALSHPWDPDAYATKATEDADTSMAGFPGTLETLSGQDSAGGDAVAVQTGDDATYETLKEAYHRLRGLAERSDQSEARLSDALASADREGIEQGSQDAEALAIDLSNLINELGVVDVTSGTYVDDREHLLTLGNWLRNHVDVLRGAWAAALEAQDPAAERERIVALLASDHGADGTSTYRTLFEDNYVAWEPLQADS